MATPDLIFCGGGSPRFAEIAIAAGYLYGSQLPNSKPYAPIYFADQDWKKPDRQSYMIALARHRPSMCTVLDWERPDQLSDVLSWAEEAAQYVERVIIIPKVINQTHRIPDRIGGISIVLGFSVPTKFGATSVPTWEFEGRMIHLLGGSPQRQMKEWEILRCLGDVITADGNMAHKMAIQYGGYWTSKGIGRKGHWPQIEDKLRHDGIYTAFEKSCENIKAAWDSRK